METVANALYCFLKPPDDFGETVISAVMAGGDTDTIGAIAGAISGAYKGVWRIPRRWVEKVEYKEHIVDLVDGIFALATGTS